MSVRLAATGRSGHHTRAIPWPRLAVSGAAAGWLLLLTLASSAAAQAPAGVAIRVENPLAIAREVETIALPWSALLRELPGLSAGHVRVLDGASGRELTAQALDDDADGQLDSLLFQAGFRPREVRLFRIEAAAPVDSQVASVRVLFVPEREDVAWESDRIAFRIYGRKLWELENLHSNGIDVWPKRTRKLVLDEWYGRGHDEYHTDRGEGADFFQVGPTLGAGGIGIWRDGRLYRGDNFLDHRIIADGPVRAIFELDYGPITAGDLQATEHKRVTIDGGQYVFRQESTFSASAPGELAVVVGLVKRPGMIGSTSKAAAWAWLSGWGPLEQQTGGHGDLGTAVLVPGAQLLDLEETADHYLTISRVQPGQTLVSYVGAGWTSSRDFDRAEGWWHYLEGVAQRLEHPLAVSYLGSQAAGGVH